MPWYRSGTVAITAGQTTVTGTGTNFPESSRVGDAFQGPDGRWYEVTNIASGTVISILPAYLGATVAAGSYGLAPMQGYVKESADRLRQLVDQYGGTLAMLGNPANPAGLRNNIGAASRGANSDITSLSGMTTALSVGQGGTGSSDIAVARANLGLGDSATKNVGVSAGQVMGVGAGGLLGSAPQITNMHNVGNTEFRSAAVASNSPPGADGYYNALHIRAGVDNRWTTILAQEINGYRLAFKTVAVDQSAATAWSIVYHTNNTTRAADGTLKAI
ncbi:phage tail protein [Pseudomonas putida]|uniref:Tail fiber domain-containing protein n=1 Tax=Pseudomonas putida TaxID=303 RepID=A0A2S3WBA8_PSEPU|nr:phage tail protein [Pseudomonas putida]POF88229.1 hypothetical protein BGP80_09715 [Pseudomonas putida]